MSVRAGFSKINANDYYWYMTFDAPAGEARSVPAMRTHAEALFRSSFPQWIGLLEKTSAEDILRILSPRFRKPHVLPLAREYMHFWRSRDKTTTRNTVSLYRPRQSAYLRVETIGANKNRRITRRSIRKHRRDAIAAMA